MADETKKISKQTELLTGHWRVRFTVDNNCQIGDRLVPVKKGQEADVPKHIAEHLLHNNLATLISDGTKTKE